MDTQFIFFTNEGQIKINPLGVKGEVCKICENRPELRKEGDLCTCAYCHSFDMVWVKDQATSSRIYEELHKEAPDDE